MLRRDGDRDADALRDETAQAAAWLRRFCAASYGPHGGTKLVDAEPPTALESAASAVRELRFSHPGMRPYAALCEQVQRHAGDGATTALLLASGLVGEALDARGRGARLPGVLEGLDLAQRQCAGVLASLARPTPLPAILATVAPRLGAAAPAVAEGLAALRRGDGQPIRLDDVDVRVEPAPEAAWLEGLVLEPAHNVIRRERPDGRILLVRDGDQLATRSGASYRFGDPTAWQAALDGESSAQQRVLDHVETLGVDAVVCLGALRDTTAQRLAGRGVLVVPDAARSLVRRLEAATGGRLVAGLLEATAGDLGRAALRPRPLRRTGWLAAGPGPAATLVVPALTESARAGAEDDAERLLRAAGLLLADPRSLPGGGRWQREAALSVRRAADAAPGHAALGMRAAADALDGLADVLVQNAGRDPLDGAVLDEVEDPAPCVRLAVDAAFQTARLLLRVDGRHSREPSRPDRLRGGTGPVGSPKGMPGDIPPLM